MLSRHPRARVTLVLLTKTHVPMPTKVNFLFVNFSNLFQFCSFKQAETLQSRNKTEERLKQCLYLAT